MRFALEGLRPFVDSSIPGRPDIVLVHTRVARIWSIFVMPMR